MALHIKLHKDKHGNEICLFTCDHQHDDSWLAPAALGFEIFVTLPSAYILFSYEHTPRRRPQRPRWNELSE
jgi:hypothetical protein